MNPIFRDHLFSGLEVLVTVLVMLFIFMWGCESDNLFDCWRGNSPHKLWAAIAIAASNIAIKSMFIALKSSKIYTNP